MLKLVAVSTETEVGVEGNGRWRGTHGGGPAMAFASDRTVSDARLEGEWRHARIVVVRAARCRVGDRPSSEKGCELPRCCQRFVNYNVSTCTSLFQARFCRGAQYSYFQASVR